jgi:hypothetical protein
MSGTRIGWSTIAHMSFAIFHRARKSALPSSVRKRTIAPFEAKRAQSLDWRDRLESGPLPESETRGVSTSTPSSRAAGGESGVPGAAVRWG